MIKISIIIPNYNNAKYLKRCLESIENQSLKDIEAIIIDDGSTDQSCKIVKDFMKDVKIKTILIEQNNLNGAVARDRGLEIATGKYIFFLDSDDYLSNDKVLEKMYNDIKDNDLLVGNYDIVNEENTTIKKYKIKYDEILNIDIPYKYCLISPVPSNKLYKNEIIKNNRIYFSNVRIGQDLNFYLKYLSCVKSIIEVDYVIYNYSILENSITRKINSNILDIIKCFEDVEKFYVNMNLKKEYESYLNIVKLKHIIFQISKSQKFNDKKYRRLCWRFLSYYIDKINFNSMYKNDISKKYIKLYRRYKILSGIFLSNIYHRLKIKKRGK